MRPAKKIFLKLEHSVQDRILRKLKLLKQYSEEDLKSVLVGLTNFEPATHRLRVGDYRLILQQKAEDKFLILDLGHRRDIYL